MLEVANLITRAATLREETRGVHYRTDFPSIDDQNWRMHIDFKAATSGTPTLAAVGP